MCRSCDLGLAVECHDTTPEEDTPLAEPECPTCHAVGKQPHTEDCWRGKGWQHAVTPPDEVASDG